MACAWPGLKTLSILRAPFKSSLDKPSSAVTIGAKCVGVGVSAQRTRRGSQPAYTCRLSSSGCPPLLLTLTPSSGPARVAFYGLSWPCPSFSFGCRSTTFARPSRNRWHLLAEHGGLDGDAERPCGRACGATAYGIEVTGTSMMATRRKDWEREGCGDRTASSIAVSRCRWARTFSRLLSRAQRPSACLVSIGLLLTRQTLLVY